jgi:3-hydroxyisobutyryl-CoA hydrolase
MFVNQIKFLLKYQAFKTLTKSMGTSSNEVLLEKINKIGCITLNRPKQLNALNLSMVHTILQKLIEWQDDDTVAMILIRGTGNTAFCAGGDIKTIRENVINGDERAALDFFKNEYKLNYEISQCKRPYVALIHGVTMGGGMMTVIPEMEVDQ